MNGKQGWETRRQRETPEQIKEKLAKAGRASSSRPFKDPQAASRAANIRWDNYRAKKGLQ